MEIEETRSLKCDVDRIKCSYLKFDSKEQQLRRETMVRNGCK
jgi:hypothetical protein